MLLFPVAAGGLLSVGGSSPADPGLLILLVTAAAIAAHLPIELSPRLKMTVDTAVYFAAVLLLATP